MVVYWLVIVIIFFFFKQKTAYEMRISDWSSDVCSSDLIQLDHNAVMTLLHEEFARFRRQLLADELIFRVGEGEPVNIVATRTLWIGKHNLGRDLFEDRVGNIALERVRRRLRGK